MSFDTFKNLSGEEQEWVDAWVDETIEEADFERLQDRMIESATLRAVMRRYLAIDSALQSREADLGVLDEDSAAGPWLESREPRGSAPEAKVIAFPYRAAFALVAGLALLLGVGALFLATKSQTEPGGEGIAHGSGEEPSARGFAVISGLFDVEWAEGASPHREGDTLGSEVFRLAGGTAEIQFFSGAVMTVEGPSEIEMKSAWEAECRRGAVRMSVPPAARGFRLHAPETEIVDLGTEFGLVVKEGESHVEVIDGEISVRHRDAEETILEKGDALGLQAEGPAVEVPNGRIAFPDASKFSGRALEEQRADFERWQSHREALARDERLIAYYTFDRQGRKGLVPNLTVPRNAELDGAVVLAEPVDGRWTGLKEALEFRRPGSRVRVNVPGEFSAFTFVAWVRIDSLDRWYNALFMGDGYETGEPHWQIRDDGKMMLSVMVDDTRPNPYVPNDAGFHRVYFSPPIWDPSMSGQWLHLASVFDPENRAVSHYVDGKRIHRQEIEDRFFIDTLRIGNGEIGNWGEPFREDPVFAIRNLNGRMDEIALFGAALPDEEIRELYERSRSSR